MPADPSLTDLAPLLARQAGVVSRQQALDRGLQPHDLRRLERRRDVVRVLPRVYVDHTGVPTWLQRASGSRPCAPPTAPVDRGRTPGPSTSASHPSGGS